MNLISLPVLILLYMCLYDQNILSVCQVHRHKFSLLLLYHIQVCMYRMMCVYIIFYIIFLCFSHDMQGDLMFYLFIGVLTFLSKCLIFPDAFFMHFLFFYFVHIYNMYRYVIFLCINPSWGKPIQKVHYKILYIYIKKQKFIKKLKILKQ